jgi:hypothetical protein
MRWAIARWNEATVCGLASLGPAAVDAVRLSCAAEVFAPKPLVGDESRTQDRDAADQAPDFDLEWIERAITELQDEIRQSRPQADPPSDSKQPNRRAASQPAARTTGRRSGRKSGTGSRTATAAPGGAARPRNRRTVPLAMWSRQAGSPAPASTESTDDLRALLSGLEVPANVLSVTYPRGCRIQRVRVAKARRRTRRKNQEEPLIILSR